MLAKAVREPISNDDRVRTVHLFKLGAAGEGTEIDDQSDTDCRSTMGKITDVKEIDEVVETITEWGKIGKEEINAENIRPVIRVLMVNCRCIMNKVIEFANLIEIHEPQVLIGVESWLKGEVLDSEVFPNGYIVYRRNRGAIGGGVFILVSKNYLSSLVFIDQDHKLLGVDFCGNKKDKIRALAAYRSGRMTYEDEALAEKLKSYSDFRGENRMVIIGGDLNLTGVNWVGNKINNTREQGFAKTLIREGAFTQVVEQNTRGQNILSISTSTSTYTAIHKILGGRGCSAPKLISLFCIPIPNGTMEKRIHIRIIAAPYFSNLIFPVIPAQIGWWKKYFTTLKSESGSRHVFQ